MNAKSGVANLGGIAFLIGLGVVAAPSPGIAFGDPSPGSGHGTQSAASGDSAKGGQSSAGAGQRVKDHSTGGDQTGTSRNGAEPGGTVSHVRPHAPNESNAPGTHRDAGVSAAPRPTASQSKTDDTRKGAKSGLASDKGQASDKAQASDKGRVSDKDEAPEKVGVRGSLTDDVKSGVPTRPAPPVIGSSSSASNRSGADEQPDATSSGHERRPLDPLGDDADPNAVKAHRSREAASASTTKPASAPGAKLAAAKESAIGSTANGAGAKSTAATGAGADAAVKANPAITVHAPVGVPTMTSAPPASSQQVDAAAQTRPPSLERQLPTLATNLLSAFGFGSFAGSAPAVPAESPGLWTMLAWTRRQIEQALSPWTRAVAPVSQVATDTSKAGVSAAAAKTAAATPTASTPDRTTGVVTGSLGVGNPTGEKLTYTVVNQPARGTITVNQTDGTYTYKPTQAGRYLAGTTAGDDTDSFTVSVTGATTSSQVRVTPTIAPVVASTQTVSVGNSPTTSVAGPDGRAYVLNTASKTISVIYPNGATYQVPAGNVPFEGDLALSPDGKRLYVSQGTDNSVRVYDTSNGAVLANFPVSNGATGIVTYGDRIYVANFNSRTVSAVDANTFKVFAEVPVGKDAYKLSVSPDGQRLYVTSFKGATQVLAVIDTTNGAVTQFPFSTQNSAFSPDGSRLYLTTANSLSIMDPRPSSPTYNQVVDTISVPNAAFVTVSPDGSLAYVSQPDYNSANDTIAIVDTATKSVIGTIPVGDFPYDLSVSPDGTRLYVPNANGSSVSLITFTPA